MSDQQKEEIKKSFFNILYMLQSILTSKINNLKKIHHQMKIIRRLNLILQISQEISGKNKGGGGSPPGGGEPHTCPSGLVAVGSPTARGTTYL